MKHSLFLKQNKTNEIILFKKIFFSTGIRVSQADLEHAVQPEDDLELLVQLPLSRKFKASKFISVAPPCQYLRSNVLIYK